MNTFLQTNISLVQIWDHPMTPHDKSEAYQKKPGSPSTPKQSCLRFFDPFHTWPHQKLNWPSHIAQWRVSGGHPIKFSPGHLEAAETGGQGQHCPCCTNTQRGCCQNPNTCQGFVSATALKSITLPKTSVGEREQGAPTTCSPFGDQVILVFSSCTQTHRGLVSGGKKASAGTERCNGEAFPRGSTQRWAWNRIASGCGYVNMSLFRVSRQRSQAF